MRVADNRGNRLLGAEVAGPASNSVAQFCGTLGFSVQTADAVRTAIDEAFADRQSFT